MAVKPGSAPLFQWQKSDAEAKSNEGYSLRSANQVTFTPGPGKRWMRKFDCTLYDPGTPGTGISPIGGGTPSGNKPGEVTIDGETIKTGQSAVTTPGVTLNLTPIGFVQPMIKFQIRKTVNQAPNILSCKVYNLSRPSMDKLQLFRRVAVSAGYQTGNYGTIFNGTVIRYTRGRDNATDTYLEIIASDHDLSHGHDVYRGVFREGAAAPDIIEQVVRNMTGIGEAQIAMPSFQDKLGREMAVVGKSIDILRRQAQTAGADFWAEDGVLHFLHRSKYREGETVVLSPSTGLIGIPQVTPQGIQVKCLLDPKIKLGGLIELRTDMISGVPYLPGSQGPHEPSKEGIAAVEAVELNLLTTRLPQPAFTSPVGKYKVIVLDYNGETRGTPWYCDMTCVALDQSGNHISSEGIPYTRINATETGVEKPTEEFGGGGDAPINTENIPS